MLEIMERMNRKIKILMNKRKGKYNKAKRSKKQMDKNKYIQVQKAVKRDI